MKRIAMFAVLAVSALAADLRAQTVQGYSKFTVKDPTLVARAAAEDGDEAAGDVTHAYASHPRPVAATQRQQQYAAARAAQAMHPQQAAIYAHAAAHSPHSTAAYNQMAGAAPMPPPGGMPNMVPNGGYPAQPRVVYPGYAPTPENMMYGGSPFPQVAHADYGYAGANDGSAYGGGHASGCAGCANGSCTAAAGASCSDGSCASGDCGSAGDCGAGDECSDGCGLGCCGLFHGCHWWPNLWCWGADTTSDWITNRCRLGYVTAELLHWESKGPRIPALLTTSPAGTLQQDAGIMGRPGTTTLFGGDVIDDAPMNGYRTAIGFWTMGAEYVGFEFNYMGFEPGGTEHTASSSFNPANGGGILAVPFFNVTAGVEDAVVLAFPGFAAAFPPVNTGAVPVDLNGTFEFDSDVEIHSAGALLKSVVWVQPDAGWRTFFLGGYRFFYLGDDIAINSIIEPVGGPFGGGSRITITDQFDSENQFHGGEVGLQTEIATGPWSVGILTKLAFGNMRQELEIEGQTTAFNGIATAVTQGGLFTQPSNIGSDSRDEFALLPEASLSLNYQLMPNLKLMTGYNFLYVDTVARAGEQIDRVVNTTQFDGGLLVGDPRPARNFTETDFFMHGWSAGIEVKW